MKKPRNPDSEPAGDSRADVLLREALYVVEPLVRLLVSNGVTYPSLAQALKRVFLDAAESELKSEGRKATDSALSLLSGVHRKDVRALSKVPARDPDSERVLSMASQVFAKWVRSDRYLDPNGVPVRLKMRASGADERSFEQLAQSVSKDFHARSVLDELIRLGLAARTEDWIEVKADAFVPTKTFGDAAYFLGRNAHDHLAAAVQNLARLKNLETPDFLEHAIFADGLSAQSAYELQVEARKLWRAALRTAYASAVERVAKDETLPPNEPRYRIRLGAYCYYERGSAGSADALPVSHAVTHEANGADS